MKKLIAFGLCLVLLMTGCSAHQVSNAEDFNFDLPVGYTITDTTSKTCSISRDSDAQIVGGMELTDLSKKDINGRNTDIIVRYLQEDFHKTYDVEYLASHWGKKNKIVIVHLDKSGNDGQEEHYSHIFFKKDAGIYHLWLDLNIVDYDTEAQFRSISSVD